MWVGLLVSLIFIALFLVRTDFNEIADAFAEANYAWALLSLPVYFAAAWFRTLRWRFLLKPLGQMSTARLFPVVIIGFMANNLIPARAGELVRAYIVREREKVSMAATLGTIVVDRLFDGLTLLAFLLGVAVFVGVSDLLRDLAISMAILFGAGLVVLALVASSESRGLATARALLRVLPDRLRGRAEAPVYSFLDGLRSLRSPFDMLAVSATSVVSWLLEATMYYMVGLAFGLELGFDAYLLVAAAANLAISVPSSPGGVGPFEFFAKRSVILFGVSDGLATAYAVALHALLLFPVIALGLYFLWAINLSFAEILHRPPAAAVRGSKVVGAVEGQGRE